MSKIQEFLEDRPRWALSLLFALYLYLYLYFIIFPSFQPSLPANLPNSNHAPLLPVPCPHAGPGLVDPGPDPGQRPGPDAMPDLPRERRRQKGLLREDQNVLRRKGQVPGQLSETGDHRLRLERLTVLCLD